MSGREKTRTPRKRAPKKEPRVVLESAHARFPRTQYDKDDDLLAELREAGVTCEFATSVANFFEWTGILTTKQRAALLRIKAEWPQDLNLVRRAKKTGRLPAFVSSVEASLRRYGRLTEKQRQALRKIRFYRRYRSHDYVDDVDWDLGGGDKPAW